MANYIVLNSKFTPYTFQDKIAPYQEYAKSVAQAKQTMQQLDMETARWEDLLSQHSDDEQLKEQYAKYKENTDKAMEYFYNYGLLGDGEQKMVDTFKGYRKTIVPMQEAYQRRSTAVDKWSADFKDNARYIGNSPEGTSLTSWMHGAVPDLYGIKGDEVYTEASELAERLSRNIIRTGGEGEARYWTATGLKPGTVDKILNSLKGNDVQLSPTEQKYKDMLQNTLAETVGKYDLNRLSEEQKQQFYSELYSGVRKGLVYEYDEENNPNYGKDDGSKVTIDKAKWAPLNLYDMVSPNMNNSSMDSMLESMGYNNLVGYVTDQGEFNAKEPQYYFDNVLHFMNYLTENNNLNDDQKDILNGIYLNSFRGWVFNEKKFFREASEKLNIDAKELFTNMVKENNDSASLEYEKLKKEAEEAGVSIPDYLKQTSSTKAMKINTDMDRVIDNIVGVAEVSENGNLNGVHRLNAFKKGKNGTLEYEFDEGEGVKKKDLEKGRRSKDDKVSKETTSMFRAMSPSGQPGYILKIGAEHYFVESKVFGSIDNSEQFIQEASAYQTATEEAQETFINNAKSKGYIYNDANGVEQWDMEKIQNDSALMEDYMLYDSMKQAAEAALSRVPNTVINATTNYTNPANYTITG